MTSLSFCSAAALWRMQFLAKLVWVITLTRERVLLSRWLVWSEKSFWFCVKNRSLRHYVKLLVLLFLWFLVWTLYTSNCFLFSGFGFFCFFGGSAAAGTSFLSVTISISIDEPIDFLCLEIPSYPSAVWWFVWPVSEIFWFLWNVAFWSLLLVPFAAYFWLILLFC